MGNPGNATKVEVTQKNVPSTWMHDGSECHPGRIGFWNVEFCAKTDAAKAKRPRMRLFRVRIGNIDRDHALWMLLMFSITSL